VARVLEVQATLVLALFNNNYSTQSVYRGRGLLELLHLKDPGEPFIRVRVSAT
jgi:hypothetical protein